MLAHTLCLIWCVRVCRTLDVNQADGGVYFGFHNEICYKPNNASSASCWVWPTSLVPDSEEFKYIYINQRTNPQLPTHLNTVATHSFSRFAKAVRVVQHRHVGLLFRRESQCLPLARWLVGLARLL